MMEILYVSNTTSQRYFADIYKMSAVKPGQQVQKFNEMLLRGFTDGNNVHALSAPPATYATSKKLFFKNETESENSITYDYTGFISLPVIKQWCVKWNARRKIARWARRTEGAERVIICYALSPTLSDATLSAARKHGIKCAALVTDIPQLMNVAQNQGGIKARLYTMYSKSTYEKMTQYDMYILLTDAMSNVVNPKQKPYVVVEGMTDSAMAHTPNDIAGKHSPKVVLYAGALFEKYGVRNLVEGFLEADIPGCELWLFGNGEMEGWLNSLDRDNVVYHGVAPNSEVVAHEIEATLLVNPRPSTEEFTKYSFPSKNMEYMMSGTPVLTCRLPGMPDEYLDYVYIARDEDAHGFAQALADIMSKDARELHEMGQHAKRFVSSEKSNICQAQKIAEFISKNL